MRWWLFLPMLLLMACGGGEPEPAPTAVPIELPTAAVPLDLEAETAESPRQEPHAETNGLPPTYTPMPTVPRAEVAPPPNTTPNAPNTTTNARGQTTYTVQRGDTLAEIALEFGVTLDALARANNILDVNRIEVGQVLVIP